MKRRILFSILVAALLLLCSCSTTIGIKTLVPAQVDVSGYKTIAVRSTTDNARWLTPSFWRSNVPLSYVEEKYKPYLRISSGLDFNTSSKVSQIASSTIYKAMDNGFFTVLSPEVTDAYVTVGKSKGSVRQTLMDNGIDAILSTEITYILYDEYIYQETSKYERTDSNNVKYYPIYFYLVQKYGVSISYTLQDVENNVIIASGTLSREPEDEVTQIGYTKNSKGDFEKSWYYMSSASSLIGGMVKEFSNGFKTELTPHYETVRFSFMKNKPKIKSLETAYDALENEDYELALELFLRQYRSTGHVASGYNAAVLQFAMNETDSACELALELYNKYGSVDALDLYYEMKNINEAEKQATDQIYSETKSGASQQSELAGF